jgi:hypothetical protein
VASPRSFLFSIFDLRRASLVRGVLLGVVAFAVSLRLGGFPDITALHHSEWQAGPVAMASWSMVETVRCAGRKWTFYYAGVLILLYTELMILAMGVVLFFYP